MTQLSEAKNMLLTWCEVTNRDRNLEQGNAIIKAVGNTSNVEIGEYYWKCHKQLENKIVGTTTI